MSLKPHFNIELQYLYNYGYGIYKKKQQNKRMKQKPGLEKIRSFFF